MRSIVPLNFEWYFQKDFQKEHLEDYRNINGFEKVELPHSNLLLPYNYLPEKINELLSTYKRILFLGVEYQGKILQLVFEGVAHACDIYLNDRFLCHHEGGYTEFTVDITDSVVFDQDNYLTVVVDNHENKDIPPFGGQVDYLGYGGIYREVQLLVLELNHIDSVYLDCNDIDSDLLNIRANTSCDRGEFLIKIFDQELLILEKRQPVQGKSSAFSVRIKGKKLWTLDDPHLYDVRIMFLVGGVIQDNVSIRFGFREVKFTKNGFYLNRKHIKLRGLNRHQSYPYVGYALPKSAQEKDADILKYDLGVNIVRTSHYPQSRHFLNRCDEIGLLVFEEIPGWNYIGGKEFRENTLSNLQAMIQHDYNHPCIIMWGVRINESMDDTELYRATNRLAHDLDKTRPTGGVRNLLNSEFLEDVYTYNDFIHSGKNEALREPDQVKKGVPYLVTEHNGHMFPTKRYDDEPHRIEHMLRHYRVLNKAAATSQISGAI
ncbi:MAG: glycoside hydrolase family 2 protein, partial [Acholeplasmataceae bacterium]|nr:glycoside hydrolase family 2 protein [Acholeplasmataceae bacterium]